MTAAQSSALKYGIALLAGAALACAFAPLNLWPLALLCPALLMWLWQDSTPAQAAWSGFAFGAGTFGAGTWWLYISVHTIGEAPIWLTLFVVLGLVCIMAAYHALLGFAAARLLPAHGAWRYLVGLPALWLLMEWWRGWFLSGFPWLTLGLSQTDTWLKGFAPVTGVYGISALLLIGSGAAADALARPSAHAPAGGGVIAAAVAAGCRAGAHRLDTRCRAGGQRRGTAGSDSAGHQVAGRQCRTHA